MKVFCDFYEFNKYKIIFKKINKMKILIINFKLKKKIM